MSAIEPEQLNSMICRFLALTTDEPRQAIVDQLGTNIWNHVQFACTLTAYHHTETLPVYLRMIEHLKIQGTKP